MPVTFSWMSFGFSTFTRTLNFCANMSVDSICTFSTDTVGETRFEPSDAQPASKAAARTSKLARRNDETIR